jgi:hypothetical protein
MTTARSADIREAETTDPTVLRRPRGTERRPVIRPRSAAGPVGVCTPVAVLSTAPPVAPTSDEVVHDKPSAPPPDVAVAPPVAPPVVVVDDAPESPGGRHQRRLRRRLIREQVLILVVLVVALAVTVALLAGQWLLNASVTGTVVQIPFSAHPPAG